MEDQPEPLYGTQTALARDNFQLSSLRLQPPFIRALAAIKAACARANGALGQLEPELADAIAGAAEEIASGRHYEQFVVDVFQTGSGTSTNMNANEVIASLARTASGLSVHPNDDVNRGQSSNDVIPSALRISAVQQAAEVLAPALEAAIATLAKLRADDAGERVKTGRTHLMDAMPIHLADELGAWSAQLSDAGEQLRSACSRMAALPLGGTAVGTGINAHPEAAAMAVDLIERRYGLGFRVAPDRFAAMSSLDDALALSAALRGCATALLKIANDLRWMSSGPVSGLSEITLPPLQPGSSIMPGKVNPVIPEAVTMVAAHVIGNDAAIALAAQSGNFQLNVMQPLVAFKLLENIDLLAAAAEHLNRLCLASMQYNDESLRDTGARNLMLVTGLAPRIGYDKAAEIAKASAASGRPVLEVAMEMTELEEDELARLLHPARLAKGGLP